MSIHPIAAVLDTASSTTEPTRNRPWVLIVTGAVAAVAAAASLALAAPTMLHGKQIAGTPTANAADVTAVKAERAEQVAKLLEAYKLASLESDVKKSMQDYWDDPNNNFSFHVTVIKVSLIKAEGNKYEGVATMTADGGPQRDIPVHVTADDRNLVWNTDPGALRPLFR